ncbi:unnamed protein product, partial [Phaeothamnion confervicola]
RVPQVLLLILLIWATPAMAQPGSGKLKPGFDKAEYAELLYMHALLYDTVASNVAAPKFVVPKPAYFKSVYRSPVMGLDNKWELWKSEGGVAVINIRGTTVQPVGWLENFYAAMVPAKGELKLTNSFTFQYDLANHPRAGVHVGWLVGTAFLARDIVPKIDSLHQSGVTDFIIMGHSQGGAIAYLMNSYLHSLQKQGKLPQDIRFKAYCSASPKAGNTYYAYEYEAMVDGGWGYNVINSADWIPEVPFSVQTLDDFNETNPFKDINGVIKKQKLITRIALRHAYKSMRKPSEKARRNYQKYLGHFAGKTVTKTLPEFQPPVYFNSSNYVRIGPTIILPADKEYYEKFPDSREKVFTHHLMAPYLYLLSKYQH